MTASELIAMAENLVEESNTPQEWYDFINITLKDLTPAAKVLEEKVVSVELTDGSADINVTEEVPEAFEVLSVSFKPTGQGRRELRKLTPQDYSSTGYARFNDFIRLQGLPWEEGAAVIYYYAKLKMIESGDDYTFNLPEDYHESVLLKGVCASAMQKEEDMDRKNDFYGEYALAKRSMLAERTFEMEPWNRMFVLQAKLGGEE